MELPYLAILYHDLTLASSIVFLWTFYSKTLFPELKETAIEVLNNKDPIMYVTYTAEWDVKYRTNFSIFSALTVMALDPVKKDRAVRP